MNILKTLRKRKVAWFFLLTFCTQTLFPNFSYAGGPDQPEVKGFTPISMSDMVDPFTGDFTYNIPLIQIEGYPLNLVYNSGVSMDQEASWVGLGWSLHTGSLNRGLRGLPDDFKGDDVEKTVSMKPITNIGVDFGVGGEIFGLKLGDLGVTGNASMGFNYNTNSGFGAEFSFGPSFKYGKVGSSSLTSGFSLSGSSENGASFAPSLSLSKMSKDSDGKEVKLTNSIGAAMNSRAGLQSISYSASTARKSKKSRPKKPVFDASVGTGGAYDLGLATYTPSAGPSLTGFNFTGSVSVSGTLWGADLQGNVAVNYGRQWIPKDKRTTLSPSYGYMNTTAGQKDDLKRGRDKSLLDFNRDKDASFNKYSKDLPSTFQTYDLFSVNAQGTGGSFRAFRNDATYVYDPETRVNNFMGSFGLELGGGTAFDISADVVLGHTTTRTGKWEKRNDVVEKLDGKASSNNDLVQEYSMLEANEKSVETDQTIATNFGGGGVLHYDMTGNGPRFSRLSHQLKNSESGSTQAYTQTNLRKARVRTNNQLYFLSIEEAYKRPYSLNFESHDGLGVDNYSDLISNSNNLPSEAKGHHIGEITQLGQDGRRYVFGLPAYNLFQNDVTFAVGETMYSTGDGLVPSNYYDGLVSTTDYSDEALIDNGKGVDEYYSKTVTPAYAHSFLLTSILTDDYVDSDIEVGPSKNDLGNFVNFTYTQVQKYKWRTPLEEDKAYFNEGLITDKKDDKASYVYGEKNLYYVEKIESKNQVLVFTLENRNDAPSAAESGGVGDPNLTQKRLKKVTLYNLKDYEDHITDLALANPLQEVEFIYSYELCGTGTDPFTGVAATPYPLSINNEGKLTLKEIKFKYQGSNKMRPRGYKFDYGANPGYDLKATDRWGSYKPNGSNVPYASASPYTMPMTNSDFPYSIQDKLLADSYAEAWHLVGIELPSGGKIEVKYEADTYGFVQHKPAAKMFEIVQVGLEADVSSLVIPGSPTLRTTSKDETGKRNLPIYFRLNDPTDKLSDYARVNEQLYFRCFTNFADEETTLQGSPQCEYVSGYADVESISSAVLNGETVGKIVLKPEPLKDPPNPNKYSPIAKAAILFGRLQLSRSINDVVTVSQEPEGNADGLTDFANSVVSAMSSVGELFTGPNKAIYNDGKGRKIMTKKSFIRLKEPTGSKIGGGSRVLMVKMFDNWNDMTGSAESSVYGQKYTYEDKDGRSYGVASYEPQLGGDENPWRKAYQIEEKKLFATDNSIFIEEPIMESQFPSPSVGYSHVEIESIEFDNNTNAEMNNVTRHSTGKVVKEFFTAKDFPTIVDRSNVQILPRNSILPIGPKYQLLNASQGFVIELNDMHGKPKGEMVYGEGQPDPLSSVEYRYQMSTLNLDGRPNFKLNNTVNTIDKKGQQKTTDIGVRYDVVSDFRESNTFSNSIRAKLGVNGVLIFVPIPIPSVWPKISTTQNRFRSSTVNKTINRFGVLKETIAKQDGSKVTTKNLAYDAETGETLVTETKTNFEDEIYSMNYPAYWNYSSFGQASKNVLYTYNATNVQANGYAAIPANLNHFEEGDILSVSGLGSPKKGWVVEKLSTGIVIQDKAGNPISGSNVYLKVIRSGNRNKQTTSMGSLTTYENPIPSIATNQYSKVLNASAVEFSQKWKTYCACFDPGSAQLSENPYVMGIKGNWRPWRSYTYLTDRSQTNYNGNTNIRVDGMYQGYNSFYELEGGKWKINGDNWTYVSEVTEFSPNGMTLETKDALGRYSANSYGFKNTLTTGTAVNTKYTQFATASFEDHGQTNCSDVGFFSNPTSGTLDVSSYPGHTGRQSVKVSAGTTITFKNIADPCEAAAPCNISPEFADNSTILIGNASAPLEVDLDANSGAQAFMTGSNQLQFYFPAGSSVSIYVTVKDAAGCTSIFEIKPIEGSVDPLGNNSPNEEYEIIVTH